MPEYRFDEIAINSKEKKKPTEEDKYTYIGLEHLDTGSLTVSRWGSEIAPTGEKLVMRKGDVLFGKRRAYQKKVAIAPFDGIFSAHGMVLRPREEVITKDFFPLFISSDYFLDEAIKISVGSLSPTINWSDLKELTFTIPTLEEQKKLAPVIWAAIDTKNAYKKLLFGIDELVKSQFIEMFKRGQYPVVRAADVCGFITKGTTPASNDVFSEPLEDSVPYLKVYNLSFDGSMRFFEEPQYISRETHEGKLARSKVFPNDVLMNIVGPPLGKFSLVTSDFPEWNINQAIAIFRAKERILPKFLLHALMQPDVLKPFLDKAQGVRQLNFSLEQCRNLEFPLPDIKEQETFCRFAEQSDKSKFVIEQLLNIFHHIQLKVKED